MFVEWSLDLLGAYGLGDLHPKDLKMKHSNSHPISNPINSVHKESLETNKDFVSNFEWYDR